MSAIVNKRIDVVAFTLLATGGAMLYYYIMNRKPRKKVENRYGDVSKNDLYLTHSVYNQLKLHMHESYAKSRIFLIDSVQAWEEAFDVLKEDLKLIKVLGMDCEWITVQRKRNPVSMLQLSSLNCTCLIRLHLIEAYGDLPQSLVQLLEDKSIFKVGVGALDDRDKLASDYAISMIGCVDLRYMAGRHRKSWSSGGLKKYAEEIAGMTLNKSDSLRRGDWEAESLSSEMQSYAAKDSQAGLAVFLCLVSLKLHSTEEYDSLTFLLTDIQRRSVPMCHGIVDLHYKQNPTKVAASSANKQKVVPTVNVSKTITSNALRTKSMYSNCVMEAPDGQVLCVCDAKKAQWYCEKGLAENVTKDGAEDMVIRLKFEPRGRPSGERDYYRSKKKNICVVCGADKSFIRKNIVPREYRKHFPEILKSHSSHDVVLLCASCHKKTGIFDQEYKEHFAQLCNAPYKSGGVTIDSDLKKVKSAARTLSGYADKLPEEKLVECQRILTQFFGTEAITDDVLQSACNLDDRSGESHDHSALVVSYFNQNSSIQEFQRMWRLRFVEKMSPAYLGDYWHVDYNHLDYLWAKDDSQSTASG